MFSPLLFTCGLYSKQIQMTQITEKKQYSHNLKQYGGLGVEKKAAACRHEQCPLSSSSNRQLTSDHSHPIMCGHAQYRSVSTLLPHTPHWTYSSAEVTSIQQNILIITSINIPTHYMTDSHKSLQIHNTIILLIIGQHTKQRIINTVNRTCNLQQNIRRDLEKDTITRHLHNSQL